MLPPMFSKRLRARSPSVRLALARVVFGAVVLAFAWGSLGASCGQTALSVMPGVVNDPANRSLRRAVFRFGLDELCSEMKMHSVPLTMRDEDPATGRFFPRACSVQELDNENLFVQFVGHGYAWSNVTERMGFEASAAVEYAHDFLMDGSTMYVYFRQRQTQSTEFQTLMVQQTTPQSGPGAVVDEVTGMLGASVADISKQVGERLLRHKLAEGFTVVRDSDGAVSFSLGLLEKGDRPSAPFDRGESDWVVLANERTEIHRGQRDYVGPVRIADEDEALVITLALEGAPAIDVFVIAKGAGDQWLRAYETNTQNTAPPGPLLFDEVVKPPAVAPGISPPVWRRMVRLPEGVYYVVFDLTAVAGGSAPPSGPFDDRAALVSYALQLGEAP